MRRSRGLPAGDRVLVVGAGFIGGAVACALADRGYRVTVLTRGTTGRPPSRGNIARMIVGDASDEAVLDDALKQVSEVIYCAGGSLPVEAERDPGAELQRATRPLLAVLEALRRRPGVRLFLISSGGTIYGEPDRLPVHESHPLNPRTAYATIKATAERHLELYREGHGLRATALRCANVYGPGQVPYRTQGVVATLLAAGASGGEVVIFGDEGAVRDYIYIDDVRDSIAALLALDDLPPVINVGSGVGTRLDSLIELVERTVGQALRIRYEPARPTDLHRVVLDVSRLRRLVPVEPVLMADGVRRTWELDRAVVADAS